MLQEITDKIVNESIDRGLNALGESPKQATWYILEKDFKFDRNKVPADLEAFAEVLEKFFGLGQKFLDALFIKYLQEIVGEDLHRYTSFADAVRGLRSMKENREVAVVSQLETEATDL
jgi:uncharacterized tellurite resistance protein B-like protein